jgi:hypothetical protein
VFKLVKNAKSVEGKEIAMEPKPDLDPELAAPLRTRYLSARTCWLLLLLAFVAGLTLFSVRTAPGTQAIAGGAVPVLTGNRLSIQYAAPGAATTVVIRPEPGDHFVAVASPAIDPQMVHRAPEGIDDAMVIPSPGSQFASPGLVAPRGVVPGQPGLRPGSPYPTVPDAPIMPPEREPTEPQ